MKSGSLSIIIFWAVSLPTRERGLKLQLKKIDDKWRLSLPTRERGLKFKWDILILKLPKVAPYAGAWIEIANQLQLCNGFKSLPTRERGLKCTTQHT